MNKVEVLEAETDFKHLQEEEQEKEEEREEDDVIVRFVVEVDINSRERGNMGCWDPLGSEGQKREKVRSTAPPMRTLSYQN